MFKSIIISSCNNILIFFKVLQENHDSPITGLDLALISGRVVFSWPIPDPDAVIPEHSVSSCGAVMLSAESTDETFDATLIFRVLENSAVKFSDTNNVRQERR